MLEELINQAAEIFEVSADALRGRSREHPVAHARQALAWVLHNYQGWYLNQVAKALNRDHSTILHALEAVETRAAENKQYRTRLHALIQKCNTGTARLEL